MEKNKEWFLGIVLVFCVVLVGAGCFWLGTKFGEKEVVKTQDSPKCETEVIKDEMKVVYGSNYQVSYTRGQAYITYDDYNDEYFHQIKVDRINLMDKKISDVKILQGSTSSDGKENVFFIMEDGMVYIAYVDIGLVYKEFDVLKNYKVKEINSIYYDVDNNIIVCDVVLFDGTSKSIS